MALMKSAEIPKDAVELSEIEASGYIWEIISEWETLSDTWALRYGPVVLGALSAVSGLLINRHYRWKLRLGSYGYFASTIPIVVMPGLLTTAFHRQFIATDMLLMKNEACPICYEVRSLAIQVGFGILYPMVLAPTSALMFASRYGTYRVPFLREGAKVMFQFLRKQTRPLTGTLTYLLIAHILSSSMFTYYEMKNNITLRSKMLAIEESVLRKGKKERT